jgi:hypothetical protein
MRKAILFSAVLAIGLALAGCATETATTTTAPVTSPTITTAPTATPMPAVRTVTGTSTIENKDGSTTLVTNYSDGSKTEVRTFKRGRLTTVTRETSADGSRAVRVSYRNDNSEVEIKDPSWAEKAMDATGDALATAADKTKMGAVEAADKAEDVGDAAKKGARKTVDATKKGAVEAADKAEDVGDAVKSGAKKTGRKIKDVVTPDKKND